MQIVVWPKVQNLFNNILMETKPGILIVTRVFKTDLLFLYDREKYII